MTRYISKQKRSDVNGKLRKQNEHAGGVDIGSREHYAAVGSELSEENVRKFGCYTADLEAMALWFKECGVSTVAMESTGVYWISAYQVLEEQGLEVVLVNAQFAKNVPGRKTDVQDCQWLQELHSYGLLRGSFIPKEQVSQLRAYWRQREGLVRECARQIHLFQKALEQMNVQLHKVITDVGGMTGLKIIRAIVDGERDCVVLAQLANPKVKSSREEIAKALTGNYRAEHIFALKQALATYDFFQARLSDCDAEIEQCVKRFESVVDIPQDTSGKPSSSRRRKNGLRFDARKELHRIVGVDLTKIDGIDTITALTVVAEIGTTVSAFPDEAHFASWLGLCPNNKKTGGKVKSTKTRRSQNRVANALRLAAQSLHCSKSALGAYYRRMRTRLGAPKAITAVAHKLARLLYRMMKFGQAYVDQGQEYYERRYKERAVANLARRAKALGFTVAPALG